MAERHRSNEAALVVQPHPRGRGRPWPKGVSGNPAGPTVGLAAGVIEARRLALQHAPHAVARLAELLDDEDPKVVCVAATALLDRAGVRPHTADGTGEPAGPVVDVEQLRLALASRLAALATHTPAAGDSQPDNQERCAPVDVPSNAAHAALPAKGGTA